MLHGWLIDTEQIYQKGITYAALEQKDIVSDQFINQILSQLGRNLESIHSERQQYLNYAFHISLLLGLNQFVFMLSHNCLAK